MLQTDLPKTYIHIDRCSPCLPTSFTVLVLCHKTHYIQSHNTHYAQLRNNYNAKTTWCNYDLPIHYRFAFLHKEHPLHMLPMHSAIFTMKTMQNNIPQYKYLHSVLKPFLEPNLTNVQEHQQLQVELCESLLPLCLHLPPAMVMAAGWRNPKNIVGGSAMSFIMTTECFHMGLVLFGEGLFWFYWQRVKWQLKSWETTRTIKPRNLLPSAGACWCPIRSTVPVHTSSFV